MPTSARSSRIVEHKIAPAVSIEHRAASFVLQNCSTSRQSSHREKNSPPGLRTSSRCPRNREVGVKERRCQARFLRRSWGSAKMCPQVAPLIAFRASAPRAHAARVAFSSSERVVWGGLKRMEPETCIPTLFPLLHLCLRFAILRLSSYWRLLSPPLDLFVHQRLVAPWLIHENRRQSMLQRRQRSS